MSVELLVAIRNNLRHLLWPILRSAKVFDCLGFVARGGMDLPLAVVRVRRASSAVSLEVFWGEHVFDAFSIGAVVDGGWGERGMGVFKG